MTTKNALEIIKKRLKADPQLNAAYLEEKKKYRIACKIRDNRKAAGLTQKELALLAGTKQSVISRLENAEYTGHSLSFLKKLASILKIKIEDFLETEQEDPKVLYLHIPPILKEAASFQNLDSTKTIIQRSHAR